MAKQDGPQVSTSDVKIQLDPSRFKIRELRVFEEVTGKTLDKLDEGAGSREFAALALIIKRRENPAFTLEEAEDMYLDEVIELLGLGDSPNAAGGDEAAGTTSTTSSDRSASSTRGARRTPLRS